MKITAFNGSPRGKNGNTYIMVEEFLAGAKEAGAETGHILLADKEIKPCLGCFSCWIKTPGQCVIKDDMAEILSQITGNDIIVYATPLYVFNVSGLMKNFLDRSIPLALPYSEKDEQGLTRHLRRSSGSFKFVVISNCGFPEQDHFEVLKQYFRVVAHHSGAEVIAEIYRGEGELLRANNLLLMPVINSYKKLLRKTGKEVVQNFKLSEETKAELEKPLIPYETYSQESSKHWDRELAKLKQPAC
jgi:multimeric flavodoxin WrbA